MSAYNRQPGGDHYKNNPIQPVDFILANDLDWCEANAVKYICRHKHKNGAEDIRKAIHYLELLLERDYNPDKEADAVVPRDPFYILPTGNSAEVRLRPENEPGLCFQENAKSDSFAWFFWGIPEDITSGIR